MMPSSTSNEKLPELSKQEQGRYSRHILLPEVGLAGQRRLKSGKVLIVGAGGLGSPAAMYLAAAGVGKIGIVDYDKIDLSNLQRQIIHATDSVGSSKCESARKRMAEINPEVSVVLHEVTLGAENIAAIIDGYDIVLDATDNFSTRYLINDACVLAKKPNIYGAIYRFEGQASVFAPPEGPCYRCLFPEPPPADAAPNCAEAGVLGVLAGSIGVIQATEAIKLLLDLGTTLIGRLLLYDALEMRTDVLTIKKNPSCAVCGQSPSIRSIADSVAAGASNAVLCASEALSAGSTAITPAELQSKLNSSTIPFLLDVRNIEEYAICKIEGCTLIPLGELGARIAELDKSAEIVVYCKSGTRSEKARQLLSEQGFSFVRSLDGGILAWIRDVDGSLTSY